MIEVFVAIISVVFLYSIITIPFRISDISNTLRCIDKKLENFEKNTKNPAK